nr:uncharacterized protein LOC129256974 [Lytechinus pictus]XP_054751182.1 uncharacterized protein LOC129256974 [Lytechinus pictus]XP_054751184.1 uncharacterized protein LOC129256974 [Lytechinus pictus]
MGDGLIRNIIAACCFISCCRTFLVLVYLIPESKPPDHYPLGYTVIRKEYTAAPARVIAGNVSFEGFHDDSDDARQKMVEDGEELARQRRKDYNEGLEVDIEGVPVAEVSQNFDLMPAGGCPDSGRGIFLLTLVHSLPPHFEQRQAIRETWARNSSHGAGARVAVIFVTPGVSPRPEVMKGLKKEAAIHNDIIHSVAGDSLSTFRPSSKVLLSMMGWTLNYCTHAKFVLFAHDELFINFHHVVARLKLVTPKPFRTFSIGRVKKLAKVERNAVKWDYVPESVFPKETYPNYCVGGAGFVMSLPFIRQVHPRAVQFNKEVNVFPASDVMAGIVTNQLKAEPLYHEEFHKSGGEANYCDLRDTLTLGDFNTPKLMHGAWRNHTDRMNCPSPVPNATEIKWWTKNVDHRQYFSNVFQFIHTPKSFCKDKDITLLALVSTHPHNANLRSAIRVTWGSPDYTKAMKVRVLFVLGRAAVETPGTVDLVQKESDNFGDILQANFVESFHNLTLKVILGLRWASSECSSAKFVYKGDDDMLVNFEHMTGYLNQLPVFKSQNLFMGNLMTMSPAIRTPSKYQIHREVYPFKYFLPYFSGGGYIMSATTVQKMSRMSETTRLIPIDDAYAGILAYRCGVSLMHAGGFIVGGSRRDACRLRKAFNMHGFKRTTIFIATWKTFREPKIQCREDDHKKNWSHIA